MKLTIITNTKGRMNKKYDKDLSKDGSSQLYQGTYKVKKLTKLEDIGKIKAKLKPNQALILGTPVDDSKKGDIFSRTNYKGQGITRTKDMFKNDDAIIMFDFDLRNYKDITLKDYRKMLIKCDPQLKHCEMYLTYGSSAGITSKKHGSTGWGSIHAYCRIHKEMYIRPYAETLFNNGLNEKFGEFKVNERIFRGYINGIVDLAVLKGDPSRIIYEASPELHKKLKRETREDLYFAGKVIDGTAILSTKLNTFYTSAITEVVAELKLNYKKTSKDDVETKRNTIARTNEIYGDESLILNNGKKIKARELLVGNYCGEAMRDPFEPEKGRDKAKAFETFDGARPAIHSFVHGGTMYYVHCDLKSIPWLLENCIDTLDVYSMVKRDMKGYVLDKAIDVLTKYTEKNKMAVKKILKECESSKSTDAVVTEDGFEHGEELIADAETLALDELDNTYFLTEAKSPLYARVSHTGEITKHFPVALQELYCKFDTVQSCFMTEWKRSGARKEIKGLRLDPSKEVGKVMNNNYYNLWLGNSCTGAEGNVQPFLDFTLDIICDGDKKIYEFVLDYIAHIVQQPEKKEGIACVLKGLKGTGKDTWIESIAGLFHKKHYNVANNMESITSQFNLHLQECLILNIGEAFFSGNHSAAGALKTLISEKTMQYMGKGENAFTANNYTRLFMSTNAEWVAPASGADERRWLILEVSDVHRGDLKYMGKFRDWYAKGGREALLYFFGEREITHAMHKAPETAALVEQKEYTLDGVEAWVYECALSGVFEGSEFREPFFGTSVRTSDMLMFYKAHTKDRYAPNINAFGRCIHKVCDTKRKRKSTGQYSVINKKDFLKAFTGHTGINIDAETLGEL